MARYLRLRSFVLLLIALAGFGSFFDFFRPVLDTESARKIQPRVAVCVTGHVRTYAKVHKSMREMAFYHLSAEVYFFAVIAKGNDVRTKYKSSLSDVDIDEGVKLLQELKPSYFEWYSEYDHNVTAGFCGLGRERHLAVSRWYHTWKKLEICHRNIERFETQNKMRFDFIFRVRPDVFFFIPIPKISYFPTNKVYVPCGIVGCVSPCLNDHLAFVPREFSFAYFTIVSILEKCHREVEYLARDDGAHLLFHHLNNLGVKSECLNLGYTLLRDSGPACARVRSPKELPGYFDLCVQADQVLKNTQ